MSHGWLIVWIMLGAGVFGGVVNFLLAKPDDEPPPSLYRSIFVGTAASILVPLFLSTISSKLLEEVYHGTDPIKRFVLLGFCLVAAISSTAFIRTLSDRVLSEVKEAKKEAKEAKTTAEQADQKVDLIENAATLPGSGSKKAPPSKLKDSDSPAAEWDSDPNKGKFGGAAEKNSRVLEATITPAAGSNSAACTVELRVRSTDNAKPLEGSVEFHLHPTFGNFAKYDVKVKKGQATDTITSWGAFTVGAVADGGQTQLELDLSQVKGGTDKFYLE